MRSLILSLMLAAAPAMAQDRDPIVVGGQCVDGKLRMIQLLVPVAGMVQITLPDRPCADAPAAKPPVEEKAPVERDGARQRSA